MEYKIQNVLTDVDAMLGHLAGELFRVYADREDDGSVCGYIVVYPEVNQATGYTLSINILRSIGYRIEIISQASTSLLALYVDVKRQLDSWDGDLDTYPLRPSLPADMVDYYGAANQEDETQ